jgi:hypothetical protein
MTKDIQKAVAKYLVEKGNEAVCENYGHIRYEMDVASISKSGLIHEFEVKISRSDFLADKRKKGKFSYYENAKSNPFGCPNYFYYVCPAGLIKAAEVPLFAGLYYYENGEIVFIKGPKRLHATPSDKKKIIEKMLRLTVQRAYLGCAMMTFKNNKIREKYFSNNIA